MKTRTCQLTVRVVDDVTLIVMDGGNCDGAVNDSYIHTL